MLNQFTANALGVTVITGASEATALGNIVVQAERVGKMGAYGDIMQRCEQLLDSKRYEPQDRELWAEAYARNLSNVK